MKTLRERYTEKFKHSQFVNHSAILSFIEEEVSRAIDEDRISGMVYSKERTRIKSLIRNVLTPHSYVSDDPKIEKIVQDEKLKNITLLLKKIDE